MTNQAAKLIDVIRKGSKSEIEALLDEGVDINGLESGKNFLPLDEAARRKDGQEIFHLLVSRGADLQLTTPYGKSILDCAIRPKGGWLLEYVLDNLDFESLLSAPEGGIGNSGCLRSCLANKRYDLFWLLKDKGFTITQENYERLLHEACRQAHKKPGEEVLSHLLGPDYEDIRGNVRNVITKLNWPLLKAYLRAGKLGLDDISVGSTILSLLRYESTLDDYVEIAEEFKFDQTEGHANCSTALWSVLSFLLTSVNCPKLCFGMHLTEDKDSEPTCNEHSAFLRSVFDWHKERFPVKDALIATNSQEKLLEKLVRYRQAHDLLSELLASGLDPHSVIGYLDIGYQHEGADLLMGASAHGNLPAVKLLIEYGADPSREDGYGYDAAHFAKVKRRMGVVKFLEAMAPK